LAGRELPLPVRPPGWTAKIVPVHGFAFDAVRVRFLPPEIRAALPLSRLKISHLS
jgi:hypothetical protein